MKETPFFFPNGNYQLFGVLHEPAGQVKKGGVVFCSPFAEEKLWTHRVFVNFARVLAGRGWAVLRFDYMGNGDSEGNFEECSVETKLSDICSAIRVLGQKIQGVEGVSLLGLRFGATLAALAATSGVSTNKLILWEPIINGSAYMREMLRINLATQGSVYKEIRYNTEALLQMMQRGETINVDGYEMSWPLYKQSAGINLLAMQIMHPGPSLIVQISKKQGEISQAFMNLRSRMGNCEAVLTVEEPFWKEIKIYYFQAENLFQTTLQWLEK